MDAFGCTQEEYQMRQRVKRKRLDQSEDCMPPKRQLTEEAMAAVMGQLNLSAAPPLNIMTVSPCPSSLIEHSSDLNEDSIRGASPSPASNCTGNGYIPHTRSIPDASRRLTPPRTGRTPKTASSPVVEGLDLACGMKLPPHLTNVHIRVTPATPPSSESSVSPGEESEPMEQAPEPSSSSSLHHSRKKNWDVVLEDLSSDSSDGPDSSTEMSQHVWLAPELQTLTAAHKNLLLPSILDEINKKELALVPWVEPERRFHDIVTRNQMTCVEESASDSEESQEDKPWDFSMHTD